MDFSNGELTMSTDERRQPLVYIPSQYVVSAATPQCSNMYLASDTQIVVETSLKRKHEDEPSTSELLRDALLNTCIAKLSTMSSAIQSRRRQTLRQAVLVNNMLRSLQFDDTLNHTDVQHIRKAKVAVRRRAYLPEPANVESPANLETSLSSMSSMADDDIDDEVEDDLSLTSSSVVAENFSKQPVFSCETGNSEDMSLFLKLPLLSDNELSRLSVDDSSNWDKSFGVSIDKNVLLPDNSLDFGFDFSSSLLDIKTVRDNDQAVTENSELLCDWLMSVSSATCGWSCDRRDAEMESLVEVLVSS